MYNNDFLDEDAREYFTSSIDYLLYALVSTFVGKRIRPEGKLSNLFMLVNLCIVAIAVVNLGRGIKCQLGYKSDQDKFLDNLAKNDLQSADLTKPTR